MMEDLLNSEVAPKMQVKLNKNNKNYGNMKLYTEVSGKHSPRKSSKRSDSITGIISTKSNPKLKSNQP